MAKYDRAFLVPYLRDICALYMAESKLDRMISNSEREISRVNAKALARLKPPAYENYVGGPGDFTGVGTGCFGATLCVSALLALFSGGTLESSVGLMVILAIPGIILAFRSFGAADRENAEIKKRNEDRERDYEIEQFAALSLVQPQVKQIQNRISHLKDERRKVNELLKKHYALNIIPKWYRDRYPAVYLYDWFSHSQSNDLDVALNTFVLEEIKDKLDIIIRNQSEEILNQRIIIANQNKSMRQAEQHHNELMNKLNRMQAADEERNTYLEMIERNTAVDAYFSMANYLKS